MHNLETQYVVKIFDEERYKNNASSDGLEFIHSVFYEKLNESQLCITL